MKQYTGTKTVKATPAVKKGGKVYLPEDAIPKTMDTVEQGYKVVYPDGYESWSPKAVFEEAYKPSETFLERLYIEQEYLYKNLEKLIVFLSSDKFKQLAIEQQNLLHNQCDAMSLYLDALNQRINSITIEKYDNPSTLTFGQAIEALRRGEAVARKGWNGKGLFVIKQVPARIDGEIIPKMQSLPNQAKELILANKGTIKYNNQCLIYNSNNCNADSWVPSISDVFAEDWIIVDTPKG